VQTDAHARSSGVCRIAGSRETDVAAKTVSAPGGTLETVDEVKAGYAFDGPALEIGALVVDGTTHPDAPVRIPISMLNRHGLIAGATGTGKTKTLQLLAEQCSANGIPVFAADIKGDLSGLAMPGARSDRVPLRATITSFGPILLSKVLGLNAVQESSLGLVFHFGDKNGLALLDLEDLRAVIAHPTSADGKSELAELGGLWAPALRPIANRGFVDGGVDLRRDGDYSDEI